MKNLFDIQDKVAIITGGSRGIGAMLARGFLENGAKVIISARKQTELDATVETLSAIGEIHAIQADLSTQAGLADFVSKFQANNKQLDILINNAGATWGEPIEQYSEQGWDRCMDLNVKSLFFLSQQLLPQLRAAASEENPSRVINIGSVNGMSNPKMPNYAYAASKAAVILLSRQMAMDLADQHINVNCISPGFFESKMTAGILGEAGSEAEQQLLQQIPKRSLGHPEDIAAAAIYLSSPGSRWITGINLPVDGGYVANT